VYANGRNFVYSQLEETFGVLAKRIQISDGEIFQLNSSNVNYNIDCLYFSRYRSVMNKVINMEIELVV